MRTSILFTTLALGALGLGLTSGANAGKPHDTTLPGDIQIFPFGLMEGVRAKVGQVPMQVQLYHPGRDVIELSSLVVSNDAGSTLAEVDLQGERVEGDGGLIGEAHLLMETIDPEITHRHDKRLFIPEEDRPELTKEVEASLFDHLMVKMGQVIDEDGRSIRNIDFTLDLSRVWSPLALPGDESWIDVAVTYVQGGILKSASIAHVISLLPAYLGPPSSFGQGRSTGTWHAGDLHVHNCRDQAISGCPDCNAESFNISGAFHNSDLKPQYQALGMDWFSTTTHSYCVNNDTEFNAIAAEAAALDDASFAVLCGTELTTLESGPQSGSDIFDTICFLNGNFDGRGTAHMGGHGITSRKKGGDDGYLDNCDDPIFNHTRNIEDVNAEGGFTIANHPGGGGVWGGGLNFNSIARFQGMEKNKAVGSEVWNGTGWNGSPEHKSWWIARLLEGKITWPFSGSDTHDSAVDFGATHVYLEGPLNDANLIAAMRAGKHYVSNGPFLVVNVFDANGNRVDVGGAVLVQKHRVPNNYPITVEVPYNVGASTGSVKIYSGRIGDSAETLIHEEAQVTGSGTLQIPTPLSNTATSWYRAEFSSSADRKSALTSLIVIALI